MFDYSSVFVFQFWRAFWFWMLSGSGVQLCDPLTALLCCSGLLPHPCSQPLLLFFYLFTENSALRVYLLASPPFPRADSAFHLPRPQSLFDYSSLFVVQFCWGGSVCPGAVLVYVTGGGQGSPAQCVVLTCSFCQLTSRQVGSRQQWRGEMLSTFLSAAWRKEAFHRLGVQDVRVWFRLMLCFCLMEEGEEKEKKKGERSHLGGRGFPQGWTSLAGCILGCSC
jgi:hypothetical protein